jgi:putative oxidoreductase
MSASLSLSLNQSSPIRRGRVAVIALWVLQIGLAAMFLMAGGSKLFGAAPMVALFNTIGIGQWFRYVTGAIEVASAVALLVPSLAVFGAAALVPTMIGAVAAELFVVHDSAVPPAILFLAAAIVLWSRRDELAIKGMTAR